LGAGIALLLLVSSEVGVRRIVLLLLIATAVALGVWLVTLTTGSSTSAGGLSLPGGAGSGLSLP
jgi:hypothetical protein